jgi:hypothetical protein
MAHYRQHGSVQPGIPWGPFTLRIPLVHVKPEWPEVIQGLMVAGATGMAIVPLYLEHFGMEFETAIALCVVQSLWIYSAFILFGDPYCPGWLTPALPLVLRDALSYATVEERIDFVNAVLLLVAGVFLLFGLTGLGQAFLRAVPRVLKAGIILGAGMSAIYGEFIPRSGGRPSRIDEYTICILLAVGVTLLLMFSVPLERWKTRFRGIGFIASLGLAPGFFLAMVAGPWVGEVSYASFRSFFFSPQTGEWSFGLGSVFFLPDFAGLLAGFSVFGHGVPDAAMLARAFPLALAAYVIGFGDIITGTAIVKDAAAQRPDEIIPIDERRTHLSVGLRNLGIAFTGGPFFPLQGPLWTGATVVVVERYRRGRQAMDSLFGGVFSYYLFGIPAFFFVAPILELFRPVLGIAFSLTLILTGFACGYVALSMPQGRVERGLIVLVGIVMMYFSTLVGIAVGFLLTVGLLGKQAWREPAAGGAAS